MLTSIYNCLASLRFTIILLFLSLLLVFFGTLDQVDFGIYHTQQKYFESFLAVWDYPPQWIYSQYLSWIHIPLPGGYVVGPLLLLNLLCAHFKYFRRRWSKLGIVFIHAGIAILLVGQWATQVFQKEYFMWLPEGGQSNYLESFHYDELVVIDTTDPEVNRVVSIPMEQLRARQGKPPRIQHPALPFRLNILGYLPNAGIVARSQYPAEAPSMPFDRGIGAEEDLVVFQRDKTFAEGERNVTSAIVNIEAPEGSLGTWLVSNVFRQSLPTGMIYPTQSFTYQGRTYEIALRFERAYLPSTLRLIEFKHQRYPGTDIPHSFESRVEIKEPGADQPRSTLIYMNHPMRYAGYTFYQASFANNDTASMFQVVENPARWVPYAACLITALGLLIQFGMGLFRFAQKRSSRTA